MKLFWWNEVRGNGSSVSRMADEGSTGSSQTLSAYPWQCHVTGLVDWSKKAHSLLESLSLESKDLEIDLDAFEADSDQPHPESVSGTCAFSGASSSKGLQSFEISDAYLSNAVQDNPHARSLERILKRFKGSEFQSDSPHVIPEELPRVSAEDVIITVMLCDQKGCKEQEYDVLASQTLHDLKDALYFVGDWMFDGLRRRSGCMFIDGAFYSDMRQPSAVDYAKDLVKWIERAGHPKLKQEPFRTMETRLCDLEMIPFGEKCCYIRQGDIEHLMYFTGARLFNKADDCPLREAYPCLIWMRKYKRQRCLVCQRLLAAWVVLDASRCPFNPAYFCRICFKHFSQDEQGRSIPPVDYKVFPYLHEET